MSGVEDAAYLASLSSARLPPERASGARLDPHVLAAPGLAMPLTESASTTRLAAESLVFRIPALVTEPLHLHHHPRSVGDHEAIEPRSPISSNASSRKKPRTDGDLSPSRTSDDASSGAEGRSLVPATANVSVTCSRGGRTRKKNWYYVLQKEENATLRAEIERLEAQKALLLTGPGATRYVRTTLRGQQRETERLRTAIWEQRLLFARTQSGIAGCSAVEVFPLERVIRLGSDWKQRRATLAELKDSILRDAEKYIAERTRYLNPTLEYSQSERFRPLNGDFCYSNFEIVPLEGFSSVSQVLEAIRAFYFNMEITWTESSGELMLREGDYESGEEGVGMQRFVRTVGCGVQIESNLLVLSKFVKGKDTSTVNADGSVGDSAFMSCDFVNDDKLFPYSPDTRLRQDTTGATSVKMFPRKDPSAPPLIVLTQSYVSRIRQTAVGAIPREVVEGVTFGPKYCFTALIQTLSEQMPRPLSCD